MRYLIVSDIHSNLEAFTKCLEVARGRYQEVLCLGDLVGYGPDPNGVVDAVREIASVTIRGNHDKACCGITEAEDFNPLARLATLWTREQLTPPNLASLRNLPMGPVELEGFEFVHGSPRNEDEYLVDAQEALSAFGEAVSPVAFFGHTHLQGGFVMNGEGRLQTIHCSSEDDCLGVLDLEEGARYLINPGSVGQPRDRDWRAAFAILDSDKRRVEFYRAQYDLATTQNKMRKAGLPEPLITRLEFGR
ncbi:MAG TPA: metallophosphoesterase family protein [Terriglobia bacterium]